MITITYDGKQKQVATGTTLQELAKQVQAEYAYDIILALMDGKLCELFQPIVRDCEIVFMTTEHKDGMRAYTRGMIFLLLSAAKRLEPDNTPEIRVEYAIGRGIYCETGQQLTETWLCALQEEMRRMAEEDLSIEKRSVATAEVIDLFGELKMRDKEKLLRYRRVSKTNVYNLDGCEDYFYGFMPASTGILKYFDLFLYEQGFMLLLPERNQPDTVGTFEPRTKLFETLQLANRWASCMRVETVGDLNEVIAKGEMNELILVQEALQEKKIAAIAEQIREAGNRKFIMIAGPSSSGKTTFSHRLSIQLRTLGFRPHPIAVDDYFVNREDTPRDEAGNYNYETLGAIDVEQFNQDMTALLNGEEISLPTYNFRTGKREYNGKTKRLGKEDILVIEGIHCLNDALSYTLPRDSKFKIYISALTQLNIDEHNRIPTTDGRLIRRMVRDARTRGSSAQRTIAMWPSVRRGEEENIFPYQEEADSMFNSALLYELSVLKPYAEPLLFGIEPNTPEYLEANRLLKFLDYFLGVGNENIPNNSILREFVGGSCFHV